jgi:hypothetical protein
MASAMHAPELLADAVAVYEGRAPANTDADAEDGAFDGLSQFLSQASVAAAQAARARPPLLVRVAAALCGVTLAHACPPARAVELAVGGLSELLCHSMLTKVLPVSAPI